MTRYALSAEGVSMFPGSPSTGVQVQESFHASRYMGFFDNGL